MVTTESRNRAFAEFFSVLKQQYATAFTNASKKMEETELSQLIVLSIGEGTKLFLESEAGDALPEEKVFYAEQYQDNMQEIKDTLRKLELPDEIFVRAVEFGKQQFEAAHRSDS